MKQNYVTPRFTVLYVQRQDVLTSSRETQVDPFGQDNRPSWLGGGTDET